MRQEFIDLQNQITESVTVQESAAVFIDGLQDQLTEAIDAADWNAVTQMRDDLKASKEKLTKAFEANTPTGPVVEPGTEEETEV